MMTSTQILRFALFNLLLCISGCNGVPSISQAVVEGNIGEIKFSLEAGEKVTNYHLISAAERGHLEILQLLLGGLLEDGNSQTELGNVTPLMVGLLNGHLEIVDYLVTAGVDVESKDINGDTALIYAVRHTPLFLQSEEARYSSLDLFLRQAQPNYQAENSDGFTALMYAVVKNDLRLVEMLIQRGSDPNYVSSAGVSSISFSRNREMTMLLVKLGASSNGGLIRKPSELAGNKRRG